LRSLGALLGRSPKRATDAEVNAARHVLYGDDPRLQLLVEQLRTTPSVLRTNPAPDRIRVSPRSTFEDLNFVLEITRLVSAWVPVADAESGRTLEFQVSVVRGGFLEALDGRTQDGGPWPAHWDVRRPDVAVADTPALPLPSLAELQAAQRRARQGLEAWLGLAVRDGLTLYPPVTAAAIELREQDLGVRINEGYLRFLSITDGIDSRDVRILGHSDLYRSDDERSPGLVIAWDRDETDDFVCVLAPDARDEAVWRMDVHDRRRARIEAPDVASYLRSRFGLPEHTPR
jgi:hypothetical protein